MRKGKESGKVFPGKCGCVSAEYDVCILTLFHKKTKGRGSYLEQ